MGYYRFIAMLPYIARTVMTFGGSQELFSKLFGGNFRNAGETHTQTAWAKAKPAPLPVLYKCEHWFGHRPGCTKNRKDNVICRECHRSVRKIEKECKKVVDTNDGHARRFVDTNDGHDQWCSQPEMVTL